VSEPAYAVAEGGGEITYEEFGRRLFQEVLHAERIEESIATVLGDRIELGPFGAGPGRFLAKVRAVGTIGRPRATPIPGPMVAYRVLLPIDVTFDLDIAVDVHTFRAALAVPLTLTARAAEPLTIVWDITPPRLEEMSVRVEVDRRSSELLRRVAGIDEELRRFMRRYVVRELEKDHVERATHIHLGAVIDAAWPMISAQFLEPGPRG
jgi:hypothetical protein